MFQTPYVNNIYRSDTLPPLNVRKSVKESTKWKEAVMDSFEYIGVSQFKENLKFWDYYRMVDGKMSYQELKDVVPNMESMQDLMYGVGLDTFLKHYDLLGLIVNSMVGKIIDFEDKFIITDLSEVSKGEVMNFKTEEIHKFIKGMIDSEVNMHLAEAGLNEQGQKFESEEEQQAYMQQVEQAKAQFTRKDLSDALNLSYTSIGLKWANATKDKDYEYLDIAKHKKKEFRDMLLSGRIFREYLVGLDEYRIKDWHPINTFFSKEMGTDYVQYGEYVGQIGFATPAEVIRDLGHSIPTEIQKKLMGGNPNWKSFVSGPSVSGGLNEHLEKGMGIIARVPFSGFSDYNFYLGLEDALGVPMGTQTILKTGEQVDRFLPRYSNNVGLYKSYAGVIRSDFNLRDDLCMVTKVYFKAQDLYGYLTYEDPETGRIVTTEVTEDILPGFLKDNGIKETFKESIEDVVKSFEVNTLKWFYRPVVYEGVKIHSSNLDEPLYLYCREMEFQIKGDSDFEVLLPVAGIVTKALAPKIMPYQSAYNLMMNQIRSLMEKELGVFLLMDIGMLSSEIAGVDDAQEALITFRNIAKETGIFPISTAGDGQNPPSAFNQFAVHNFSVSENVRTRVELAEFFKNKAFEAIGYNPNMFAQDVKYQTAEGIKISNEANYTQVADIFDDFSNFERKAWELHLAVAQYCQSNKKDLSVYYTKSDSSVIFLRGYDENFPLRRFGLLPSQDSKKKKQLEQFKQHMMQINTWQESLLDVSKLYLSDTMTEAIDILKASEAKAMEKSQLEHQRQQELINQQLEGQAAIEKEKQDREDYRAELRYKAQIESAAMRGIGQAGNKETSEEAIEQINRRINESSSNVDLKKDELEMKRDQHSANIDFKNTSLKEKMRLEWEKLKLKNKELDIREKVSNNQIINSSINKN